MVISSANKAFSPALFVHFGLQVQEAKQAPVDIPVRRTQAPRHCGENHQPMHKESRAGRKEPTAWHIAHLPLKMN